MADEARGEKRPREEGGEAEAAASEQPLPAGWSTAVDPTYNTRYWYNHGTRERSWTHPSAPAAPEVAAAAAAAVAAVVAAAPPPPPPPPATAERLPPGWRALSDPTTGRPYFAHALGATSWTRPQCAAAAAGLRRCKGCGGFGVGLLKSHGFCLHCSTLLGRMPPGVVAVSAAPSAPAAQQPVPSVGAPPAAAPPWAGGAQAHVSAAAAAAAARGARAVAGGRGGRGRGRAEDELDPMDPAAYSDAPRGGWGAGLYKPDPALPAKPRAPGGGAPAVPAAGGGIGAPARPSDGKDGLGEAD